VGTNYEQKIVALFVRVDNMIQMLAALVLLTLSQDRSDESKMLIRTEALRPNFIVAKIAPRCFGPNQSIVVYQAESVLPMVAGQVLLFADGNKNRKVSDLNDLEGKLTLRNAADALAYVRIRSNPATFRFFWQPMQILEILPKEKLPPNAFGGDKVVLIRTTAMYKLGAYGIMPQKNLASWGYKPPTVTRIANTFTIHRWVLYGQLAYSPGLSTETVTTDGHYTLSVKPMKNIPLSYELPIEE